MMKRILCPLVLLLPALVLAAGQYECQRVATDGGDGFRVVAEESADLSITGEIPVLHVRIRAASKEVSFASCVPVKRDSSNFSRWFGIECRSMHALDGRSFSYEPYLAGAYAGISPVIGEDYPLREKLQMASKKAGVPMPVRTVVIYANRKPQMEFFCYERTGEPGARQVR